MLTDNFYSARFFEDPWTGETSHRTRLIQAETFAADNGIIMTICVGTDIDDFANKDNATIATVYRHSGLITVDYPLNLPRIEYLSIIHILVSILRDAGVLHQLDGELKQQIINDMDFGCACPIVWQRHYQK